jgi:transcriptional regulator with XRE-family HTH domain
MIDPRLRAARKAAGLTLADIAKKVGVSVPFLSDVERGRRGLTPARRAAVAAAVGIPVEQITPLDPETIAVVVAILSDLGGCDRAVRHLRQMARESTQ